MRRIVPGWVLHYIALLVLLLLATTPSHAETLGIEWRGLLVVAATFARLDASGARP